MSDPELLQNFVREDSQTAFAELVARHVNLVYSAALRQVPAPHLAEEVAQLVFLDLARHAARLPAAQPLAPWLYVVTRRTAIDIGRREARRTARERTAAEIAAMQTPPHAWKHVEPLLDEAMETLNATERGALVLRFFENRSLREVGAALGISEDTAQKRVSRALDRLRGHFAQRGVAVSTAALATNLSSAAVQTAPAALASAITSAVASASLTSAAHTVGVAAMTTLQKSVALTAFAFVGGFGLYEGVLLARQSSDLESLRADVDRTAAELRAERLARDTAAQRLGVVEKQIDARLARATPAVVLDPALAQQASAWLAQIDRLKRTLVERPEWNIPEIALLPESVWFQIATDRKLDSDEALRGAAASIRHRAENMVASRLSRALRAYATANGGKFPSEPSELAPFCDPPLPAAVFGRYEVIAAGAASEFGGSTRGLSLGSRSPADPEHDAYWWIGANSFGNTPAIGENIRQAQARFTAANSGRRAVSAAELMPYLRWPVAVGELQQHLSR